MSEENSYYVTLKVENSKAKNIVFVLEIHLTCVSAKHAMNASPEYHLKLALLDFLKDIQIT